MRLSRFMFLGLFLAFGLRFAMLYAALPPVVASHFGFNGQADGWMPKHVFALFSMLPLVVSLLVVFIGPFLTAKLPVSLINLPNKDYWLAPERKAETLATFAGEMEWFGVGLLAFFIFVYELVYRANQHGTGLDNGPFITGLIMFFVATGVWLVRLHRKFALPSGQ